MSRAWFAYVNGPGEERTPLNYIYSPVKPTCFEGSPNICAVYAEYDPTKYGIHPVPFDDEFLLYLAAAKATSNAQPIGLNVKKFIYTYPGP
jgi:hypothetical protein